VEEEILGVMACGEWPFLVLFWAWLLGLIAVGRVLVETERGRNDIDLVGSWDGRRKSDVDAFEIGIEVRM